MLLVRLWNLYTADATLLSDASESVNENVDIIINLICFIYLLSFSFSDVSSFLRHFDWPEFQNNLLSLFLSKPLITRPNPICLYGESISFSLCVCICVYVCMRACACVHLCVCFRLCQSCEVIDLSY